MNNNTITSTFNPFLKLKNKNGEDIYSIDMLNIDNQHNHLVLSPLQPIINIFDTLVLNDKNMGNICEINLGEIFINALTEAIENNLDDFISPKGYTPVEEMSLSEIEGSKKKELVESLLSVVNKIVFREISECFPNMTISQEEYAPPNCDCILDELGKLPIDKEVKNIAEKDIKKIVTQTPYVREEPKIGRNDDCLCGSGKKYKFCCGQEH